MILSLLAHIVNTLACLWAGCIFYKYGLNKTENKPVIFYALTGLIFLTLVGQVAAVFIPVGQFFSLLIFLLLLLAAIFKRKLFRDFFRRIIKEISSLPAFAKIVLIISWLTLLLINAGPVMMDDSESYHIQMIKWIQEYGTVPGIANLHERYGFNSSWFTSIALFSPFSDVLQHYTVLNGALSLWFCYYIISAISVKTVSMDSGKTKFSLLVVLLVALVVWPLTRGNSATTNYDFITLLIVFVLFTESFLNAEKISIFDEWVLWPVYLFTVRIINYPLLLFALAGVFFLIKARNRKSLFVLVACCCLLLIPFLGRNIMLSGYAFFPSSYFDFFNVDWKYDATSREQLLQFIKYYNRVNTGFQDLDQTAALETPGWIPVWFKYLYWYDKLLLIPGLGGVLLSLILLLKKQFRFSLYYRIVLFTFIATLFSWFFIAPDPRFVYGVLISGIFLLLWHLLSIIKIQIPKKLISATLIVTSVLLASYSGRKIVRQPAYHNWLLPSALPQPAFKEVPVDNIILRIPQKINDNWNARCFATPLPCLYEIHPRLRARGTSIRDGFHLEK